jgi:hypothetical protein
MDNMFKDCPAFNQILTTWKPKCEYNNKKYVPTWPKSMTQPTWQDERTIKLKTKTTKEILDLKKTMIDATPPYGKDYLAAKENFERMQRSQLVQNYEQKKKTKHRKETKGGRRKSQMRKSKKKCAKNSFLCY